MRAGRDLLVHDDTDRADETAFVPKTVEEAVKQSRNSGFAVGAGYADEL